MSPFRSLLITTSCALVYLACSPALRAAVNVTSATVTRVENKVSYGKVIAEKSEMRPAEANDVIKANDFLLSESESRAELKYDDGTIVRIGQNTIFSFETNTRTLNLKKGTFVFYVPHATGGATIKTPSITAAITGTVGKVSVNTIAIIEGTIKLIPGGQLVHAGEFARRNPDGTITIAAFDPMKGFDGKLMTFNGKLPGLPETAVPTFSFPPPREDPFTRNGSLPSGVLHFNPSPVVIPRTRVNPPPPPPPLNNTHTPY